MNTASPRFVPRLLWGLVRVVTAVAIGYAVFAQVVVTLGIAFDQQQHVPTVISNFFSFFTILSNVTGAIVFFIAGLWLIGRGRVAHHEPAWLSFLLLCVSTYMIITGIVYNLLLRGIELPQGTTVPWSNEVLHSVGPAIFLLDVLLRVARRAQPARWVWGVVVFPIVWVVYTMIRGELVTNPSTGAPWWYPYPFLSPYLQPQGYISVAGWVVVIATAFILVSAGAAWWSRVGRAQASVPAV